MKYVLGQAGVDIINEEYTHEVVLQVAIPQIKKEGVLKELTEVTNGKLKSEELEIKYMPKKIK
jgi:putative IMPACT (imprinted ancient) family translation regulator